MQQGVHAAKAQRGVVTVESVEELVMKVSAQLMAEENGRGRSRLRVPALPEDSTLYIRW